ncbi:potassium-transporting ATPase subunit KdpC [Dehalobacter sp. DCM]|nr:potassium-transporting ATPase subunit KdpC [Dehalobacter sp. DCM]
MLIIMTILLGLVYPLAVTGLSQLIFPKQANGSLLYSNNRIVGSELIGQEFTGPEYFYGRPSAAGAGYDAVASSGSNLGPTNESLMKTIGERITEIKRENNLTAEQKIPADMVAASGSGLDPHISPQAALLQIPRVARARGLTEEEVRIEVQKYTETWEVFILGEPRVNVLKLNLALDQLS